MNHIHISKDIAYLFHHVSFKVNPWWSWWKPWRQVSPLLEPGSSKCTIQTYPVPLDQWSNLGGSGMRVDHFHHIFRHFTAPKKRRMKKYVEHGWWSEKNMIYKYDISIIYMYIYTHIVWILHDGRWCYILYIISQCWTYNSCCMEPSFHWFFWNVHKHIYSRCSKFTTLKALKQTLLPRTDFE